MEPNKNAAAKPTPPATPQAQAKQQAPAADKPVSSGLDFAAMYLETPDFEDRSATYLPEIHQTARFTGQKVFMPSDDKVRRTLRERNPAIKDGEIDTTLANMKRQYERLENNRYNAFRTGWRGMPDTTYNQQRGYITSKPVLDQRPTDPYAKRMHLKGRSVAQEFDLSPEQIVAENMGRASSEETDAGKLGGFERTENEYQQAKDRFKQTGFTVVSKRNEKTGQQEPARDAQGHLILDEGPIDPTKYGYQATLGEDGEPMMMRIDKRDLKQFRGELLNVHDLVSTDADNAIRSALFGTGEAGNFIGRADQSMAQGTARYNLNSTTGESVGKAAYDFLGYTGKSASTIAAFVGGKVDKDFEGRMLGQAAQSTAALNADMRQGAFDNVPSFLNSMSQLTNQLTVQQAFNFALPGAGIAVTALDATANGYYEGRRNGLTETEANVFGVGMGALAWGFQKMLVGQAASKLGLLMKNGAQNEVNAIVRAEIGGLAKLLGKKATDQGRQLTTQEISAALTQAKPWIVDRIGGKVSALYDKMAGSTLGSAALGGVEEFGDEFADTASEDLTRKMVSSYLTNDESNRPDWVKKSMEDGTNAFAYKSVADIMSGALEGGMLGAIGGTITRVPYAAGLAREHREAKAFEDATKNAGATEAFANYLVKNDFSADAVNRVKKTLDKYKEEGKLGVWLDADGKVTDDESKSQNAIMHRSLVDKVDTLTQLSKQSNLLAFSRGEGKSKLAEELSRAIGRDEDYMRTQQGMSQLLSVLEAKQHVAQAGDAATAAITKAVAPAAANGDPGVEADPSATEIVGPAPDANGDGVTSPALEEDGGIEPKAKAKGKDKKGKKDASSSAEPAGPPSALGADTPLLTQGQKLLEELAPKLGPAGNLVNKWAENRRNQLNLQQQLLTTDGEDVQGRADVRAQLGKLQQEELKINDDISEASAQTPAVGVLKSLAQAQHELETAAVSQKQLFDGTLLSYQVQEGLLRLQTGFMERAIESPTANADDTSALRHGLQAMNAMATNPATGQLDAAWIRQQLVDNEEYVARRRFAPLSQDEAARVRGAQVGAQAVQGLTDALKNGNHTRIEEALAALEQAAPGRQAIAVLDAQQAAQAQQLLGRTNQLDQRTDDVQARPTLDPAQVPLTTEAPATPEKRGAAKPAETTAPAVAATPSAEQVANQEAQQAEQIADQADGLQAQVMSVQAEMAQVATLETAEDEGPISRVQQVLQTTIGLMIDFTYYYRQTWNPDINAAYFRLLDAMEAAHNQTHATWHEQMAFARITKNKKKIAQLKTQEPAAFKPTVSQERDMVLEAQVVASKVEAERVMRRLNIRRAQLATTLNRVGAALAAFAQALRKRGTDLKELAAAKAAIIEQRARYGVRSLANQSAHLLYEQLLPRLRPLAGAGSSTVAALRTRLGKLAGQMRASDMPTAPAAKASKTRNAPGIDGVTDAVGQESGRQVEALRSAIANWRSKELGTINSKADGLIQQLNQHAQALRQALEAMPIGDTSALEAQVHETLAYFGRPAEQGTDSAQLLALVDDFLQEEDEHGMPSPEADSLKSRVDGLLKRLVDPVDLQDLRGSDPDQQADLEYLTGLAGMPGQLVHTLTFLEQQSEGQLVTNDKTNTPEKQQAAFAATPEAAIIKLRDAAQRNLGLALYRVRIVPLLTQQGAMPKPTGGMGFKELDGLVAGIAILRNQQLLQRADELLDKHRKLGVNRYLDDNKEQQLVLAHRQQVISSLLDLPSLGDASFSPMRQVVRAALDALLMAGQDSKATLAHLDAAEAPLREVLRQQPQLPLALLEDLLAGPIAAGRSRRETLSALLATKDGAESSPALVLTELLGPPRSTLAQHRLERLSTTRGGQSGTQPTATDQPQLSLEQEYVLQSVLSFLGTDQLPLTQLMAKYSSELGEEQLFTGSYLPAVSGTMAISGRPGTGKTFLSQEILAGAARLLGYSESRPMPVLLSAPKPSQRSTLADMATAAGKTVAATMVEPAELLKKLLSGQSLNARTIVLDEGTALSVEMSKALLSAVESYNTGKPVAQQVRLIVLEDPLQLPGISEESASRSDAGHPFISQDLAMLRSRPLKQVYRSGYITLHNGLGKIGDRILTGIDAIHADAQDLSPVVGIRYAQPGGIDTLEGWTYLDEKVQREQIIDLVKALGRSNPERKNVRVLVAPGQEKLEIDALVAMGLTENQAAGIVFAATDPRDQLVLNYDDAQGGQFHYVFVATKGEEYAANALRATYVGASRAQQYASVRLLAGQQPQNEKETGSLVKYDKLEGETVRLRNEEVIGQLQAVAKPVPGVAANEPSSNADDTEPGTDEVSDTVVTPEGELARADNVVSQTSDTATATTAADVAQQQADASAKAQVADSVAPAGTESDNGTAEETGAVLDPAQAESIRARSVSLADRYNEVAEEITPTGDGELTAVQETRLGLRQDLLSEYSTQLAGRMQTLAEDLQDHLSNPATALAEGEAYVAQEQQYLDVLQEKLSQYRRARSTAMQEAVTVSSGYAVGQLPAVEGMPAGQQPGILTEMREDASGRPVPVRAVAYVPDVDFATGKIRGVTPYELSAETLAGMNGLDATRALRKFLQDQEQLLSDVYYQLGRDVASIAARKGRLVVHSYALPVAADADEPTVQQVRAKNGLMARLFDKFTIGHREELNPQSLSQNDLNGLSSEEGPAFKGNGTFMLRYVPTYNHNYLATANEPAERAEEAAQNRFVVEYVERDNEGTRTMTIGLVRYDQGAGPGRVRPNDGTKPDTDLDNLLAFAHARQAQQPQGVPLGESVTVEGWRNGRMFNKRRFEVPYSESYSVGELLPRLAAENKSASNLFTVTTPSTLTGIKLSANHALVDGSAGRQVLFIGHGRRAASEIDALVAKALKELPKIVTNGSRQSLGDLSEKQLSAVLQGLLERYDLQMVYLGNTNLTLDHYGTGLRSTVRQGQVVTLPRPSTPEGLEQLLGTAADANGDITKRYEGSEHPVLPWSQEYREPLMGSMFAAEQMRATGRNGKTKAKVSDRVDENRPGILNTVRNALFNSNVFAPPINGSIVASDQTKKHLSASQVLHLEALANELLKGKSWPSKNSGRYSAAYLQDIFLYLDYLQGRGLNVQEAWQEWEKAHPHNVVQFNGYVRKADRENGKAPLFAKTTLPPGLSMEQMFTTQYKASAEPSFQLNLGAVASRLIGGVQAAQVQAQPMSPVAAAAPAPVVEPTPTPAPAAELPDLNEITAMPGDELGDGFELTNTGVEATTPETPAADAAPTPTPETDAKPKRASRLNGAKNILGGGDATAIGGSTLMAGIVADPEPSLPATIETDINWVLGEDFPRNLRDAITDVNGVPADYTRVLGRFFRGVIELNRLPGNQLSRVAGRHEPLHAIMWLLTPEQQQQVLSAARTRIVATQGASVVGMMSDTDVEEWLADQFVKNWDVWQMQGEAYRNHPLVKRLSRTALGRELLKFWQGIRNVYDRYINRKDAVDRLFASAHRGFFLRSKQELLARQEQSTDPAKYATRERTNRREAYEALRKRIGQGVLMETEQKIASILYGAYLYNYVPGEPPFTVGEALDTLKVELKDFIREAVAGTPDGDPNVIAEASTKLGTMDLLNYAQGTRLAVVTDFLLTEADQGVAPGLKWLDVLLRQQYAFADMAQSDANAQNDQDADTVATPDVAGDADNTSLSSEDAAVMGAGVTVHQRDSNLVDKEREALESDRLQRQLETVPRLTYQNGRWVKQGNLRVFSTEDGGVPRLKHVLFSAYAQAKQNSLTPHPTRGDVAKALFQMAEPGAGSFGVAAASLLARYFNVAGMLQVFDVQGSAANEPSFHEIAQGTDTEWARFMGDALAELHSFYSTVEPRTMLDVDADALSLGNTSNTLRNPISSSAKMRKNIAKSAMFLASFVRKGPEYVPNVEVLNNLVKSGFNVNATLDAKGRPVVNVGHTDLPGPLLTITRLQSSGAVRGRWVHGGGFTPEGAGADYWNKAVPLVQRLVGTLGLTGTIDGALVRNLLTEHVSQDRRDFTDPLGARTLLGKVLAQTLGQNLTAHIEHGRRKADGSASVAALEALTGSPKERLALAPVLHTDLSKNTDKINDFLDRKSQLGREVNLLSPTVYWTSMLDLSKKLDQLVPEKQQNTVRNDKNQKKSRNRNTTAVYPRLRSVVQLSQLGLDEALPLALQHLSYLRNVAGGYVNLFATGKWKIEDVLESNVMESRRSGKRKLIVKASSEELYQHVFWGGFLNRLVSSAGSAINAFNVPRSDKPTQKDFAVADNGLPVVAKVTQAADGRIQADEMTRSLVAHQQQAVRSIMTHDSFNRITGALQTLLTRPSAPARSRAEQRPLTAEERTEIDGFVRNLFQLRKMAQTAAVQGQNPNYFEYSERDSEEVMALTRLGNAYSEVIGYLKGKDGGTGYWLSSMNLDANADYSKAAGTYPQRVLAVATKPRAQYIDDELQSLAAEVNDVMSGGLTFIPGKLANKAYAAMTGMEVADAEKELGAFRKSASTKSQRVRYVPAGSTVDRYHPLLLSGLLTYRLVSGQVEQVLNGHHLYFPDHQTAVKRGMARETPIEIQDQEAARGLQNQLGIVGFEDTKLHTLHGETLANRYGYVRRMAAGPDGRPVFESNPLATADQTPRMQTPILLGLLALEGQGIAVTEQTPLETIMAAGMKQLAGTDAHDGISFMNMLQYRAEGHGYGNKYSKEQTMQKNILTGQVQGSSVLGKTATMLFTNELLDLGNEYMYNQFVASMGGMNSLPMRAWMQARVNLSSQAAKQDDPAKWLAQQLRENRDWDMAEELLHTDAAYAGQNWRGSLAVAGMKSAIKTGAVGIAAPLDPHAHYQRVLMQLAESGRVLSMHADLDGSTIARITQEEHIPAGLGENFSTTQEVYGFLQELAKEGLLNLSQMEQKSAALARDKGLSGSEAERAFFYQQLEQLMAGLDQRGTTLSAVQRNYDPNLSLLQQHLQTSIAQAINGAVSKLRLPGVRASVASLSGMVNMYEVTFTDAQGQPQTTRMTQQELMSLKTKQGQRLVGRTAQGQLLLSNFFHGQAERPNQHQAAFEQPYREGFAARPDHAEWYVEHHLHVVDRIADDLQKKHGGDRSLIHALVYAHDLSKAVRNDDDHATAIREAFTKRNFNPQFINQVIAYVELMDRVKTENIDDLPIEVRVVSTADALSHYTGGENGFLNIFSTKTKPGIDPTELASSNEKKRSKDQRKILLPGYDLSQQQISYDSNGGTQVSGPVTDYVMGLKPATTGGAPAIAPRYSVKVDELRFMHVTNKQTGAALNAVETLDLYRTLRASERGDAHALARVQQQWKLGEPDALYEIEPAEILMPRAILRPFFSPNELAGLTARQVRAFDAKFFARRELKYLSYRNGLSKADLKLYDELSEQHGENKEAFKQALRQLAAARGLEIHGNLQVALTPKGTRIPVTNLNSMQLFRVAGFFDSHANTSIVPSELLTVSGADNDGDQISHEFYDVNQRGLSELANGGRPTTELDPAQVMELLGKAPASVGVGSTLTGESVEAENDAPDLENGDVDTADDAEQLAEKAQPTAPVDLSAEKVDTSVKNVESSDTNVESTGAQVDTNTDAAIDDQPEQDEDAKLPARLRRSVQAIRRSLFVSKSKVLRNARNILDMMAPIDFDEFIPFGKEAERQVGVFSEQRQGAERTQLKRSGHTGGAYELFRNLALHLANQAGKTGVGPFVKARELFDVYRMARANGGNVQFRIPYAFMGRITGSLEEHSRQAMRQLEQMANAALDNAKYGFLGTLNVNEHTWGLYSAGVLGGMSFSEVIPTLNHQYLRETVRYVTGKNTVRDAYPLSLIKALETELIGRSAQRVAGAEDVPGTTKAVEMARGWYKGEENVDRGDKLFQLVHAHQLEQAQQVQAAIAAGTTEDAAWMQVYGFTRANLMRGEVTRADGRTEPVNLGATYKGTEEDNVRRYVLEQGFLLANRGREMREQIGLLTVLAGIPTGDFDALKQAQNAAKALGLDPEANDLGEQLQQVGQGDFTVLDKKRGKSEAVEDQKNTLGIPTRLLLTKHPYLQTGLQGLGWDVQKRQSLLLRRSPVLHRLLERALRSAYGRLGLEYDRYNYGRNQLERLADVAFLKDNPLVVDNELLSANAAVSTDLQLINRAAQLGQHTMAGQEMTRRAIARLLQTLQEQPEETQALGGAGRSMIIQSLQFSADGRRLMPEVRNGTELTPMQKMTLESAAEALPMLTTDPASGRLVQQLLLYYQLTGGGLKLGRGQLTELLPASVLAPVSNHREQLVRAWDSALNRVEAREEEIYKQRQADLRAKAKAKGDGAEKKLEAQLKKDDAKRAEASIAEASRQSTVASLLREDSNEQVNMLAGLLDQYALPLARPEWLASMEFTMADPNGGPEDLVLDETLHYAKNASLLPTIVRGGTVRDGLGGSWLNDPTRMLPRYVQARTGGVAGHHVYAALPLRDGSLIPVWVKQYPITGNDAIPFGEDRPALSFLPVFDDTQVTDGLLDDATKSPAWEKHNEAVRKAGKALAKEVNAAHEKKGLPLETELDVINRLGHFLYGGREMPLQEVVKCGTTSIL